MRSSVAPLPGEASEGAGDGRPSESPADWPKRALDYVAETHVVGDPFHEVLLKFLAQAAEGEVPTTQLGARSPDTSAESLEANPDINPLGLKLDEAERASLNGLLGEYRQKMREFKRDLNLTHKMCTSKSLLRGEYRVYPAGTENINDRISKDTESMFDNPLDWSCICLPAPNGEIRAVVLHPDTSPEYFSVLQAQRRLQVEHAIAVRMFFAAERR